jgi:hypothetical protein
MPNMILIILNKEGFNYLNQQGSLNSVEEQ